MALPSSRFRRAGFALAAIAGASVFASFSAAAQQATGAKYNGTPACAHAANQIKCEEAQLDRRTREADRKAEEAKQRGKEADQRNAKDQVVVDCTAFLIKGMNDKTITLEEIRKRANGDVTEGNACPVARSFGYVGRKADANPSTPR